MEVQYRFGGCVGLDQQNPHQDPGGRREGEHRHLLPSLPSHPHPLPSHLPLGRANSYYLFPMLFSLWKILRIQCNCAKYICRLYSCHALLPSPPFYHILLYFAPHSIFLRLGRYSILFFLLFLYAFPGLGRPFLLLCLFFYIYPCLHRFFFNTSGFFTSSYVDADLSSILSSFFSTSSHIYLTMWRYIFLPSFNFPPRSLRLR